ncbi:transcriptional regulatory protein AlgP-like [Schistocerca serialis cubense]|uniref:transcriptional regulatory protein AlgP-like n=1 Tax=Schistocerca serialis cubense TaxID=2023355 RepID=UPI00214E865D|nr:transcriptional regulatory protein AlgP-like [Schistocerca serialis cubense]
MRSSCPKNKRVAQLPRENADNAAEQAASYAGILSGQSPRANDEPAVAEAAAPAAPAEAAQPATPAPAAAAAVSAGEKRHLSSDSDNETTMEAEPAAAPSPAARRVKVTRAAAPAQPSAEAVIHGSQLAGPSAESTPTSYTEAREIAIKKQVTKLARILKESDDEPKECNEQPQPASKAKRRRNRRRSRSSSSNDERMETSDGEASDISPENARKQTTEPEDLVLRPDRPQQVQPPPPHSA